MAMILLAEFIGINQEELLDRCRKKRENGATPQPPQPSRERGIALFLDQLGQQLRHARSGPEIQASASDYARDLFVEGFAIGQIVHDYGDVCQSITDLAVETGSRISAKDYRTLNQCLDDAIAYAVGEYARQVRAVGEADALQARNLVYLAVTSFDALREGRVGIAGATGEVLHRSLLALSDLVNQVDRRPSHAR